MAGETDRMLARALAESHAPDAARILERFPSERAAAVLSEWGPRPAAAALERMVSDGAAACLASMSPRVASETLAELDVDSAAVLLRRAPPDVQASLLERAGPRAEALRLLLTSPAGTAGSLLDPLVLALASDTAVSQALARVRAEPRRAFDYLYVVDRAGGLAGVTSVRELVGTPAEDRLESVMHSPVMRLHIHDDRSAILVHPGWNEFHALPVVDGAGRFVGAIRHETLRRLETEGAREGRGPAAVSVAVSLGELYWIGLCGLLEGLGAVALRGGGDDKAHGR